MKFHLRMRGKVLCGAKNAPTSIRYRTLGEVWQTGPQDWMLDKAICKSCYRFTVRASGR